MNQRDIVLVPFPFADLSGSKVRPALILSNDAFNAKGQDIVICAITTNIKDAAYAQIIRDGDLESGNLGKPCSIKVESVIKINKSLVMKRIGKLSVNAFASTISLFMKIFK